MLLPEGAPISPDGYDVGKHPVLRGWYLIQRRTRFDGLATGSQCGFSIEAFLRSSRECIAFVVRQALSVERVLQKALTSFYRLFTEQLLLTIFQLMVSTIVLHSDFLAQYRLRNLAEPYYEDIF